MCVYSAYPNTSEYITPLGYGFLHVILLTFFGYPPRALALLLIFWHQFHAVRACLHYRAFLSLLSPPHETIEIHISVIIPYHYSWTTDLLIQSPQNVRTLKLRSLCLGMTMYTTTKANESHAANSIHTNNRTTLWTINRNTTNKLKFPFELSWKLN